ncbi:MAG TPA: hypothetical protein DCE43_16240, partial [Planctomycetaceae bacterium]|nr:hypothetical protein [Planctomycetaceae bacterium]
MRLPVWAGFSSRHPLELRGVRLPGADSGNSLLEQERQLEETVEMSQQVEESRPVTGSIEDESGSPGTARSAPGWGWFLLLLIGAVAIGGTATQVMFPNP